MQIDEVTTGNYLADMRSVGVKQLKARLQEYRRYFDKSRPHQGIGQRVPCGATVANTDAEIVSSPVLDGLHHEYKRAT
jgi:hypothetical protein